VAPRHSWTVVSLVGALALGGPGHARAQEWTTESTDVPWPCEILVAPEHQDGCLAAQQALTDSDLAMLQRYATERAPAALTFLGSADYAPPLEWATRPPRVRALLEARFRLEVLRFLVFRDGVATDSDLHSVAPIDSKFRPDDRGRGLLMMATNYSNVDNAPAILLYSPVRDERRLIPLVIVPGRTLPYGWMQGWTFVPGDLVEVRQHGFRPRLTVAR